MCPSSDTPKFSVVGRDDKLKIFPTGGLCFVTLCSSLLYHLAPVIMSVETLPSERDDVHHVTSPTGIHSCVPLRLFTLIMTKCQLLLVRAYHNGYLSLVARAEAHAR